MPLHVFYINNPITLLVSFSIIKNKNFKKKDVLFLIDDVFSTRFLNLNILEYKTVILPKRRKYKYYRNYLFDIVELYLLKQKITFLKKYYFYVAHDLFYASKLFALPSNCLGLYYIEEGILSYQEQYIRKDKIINSFYKTYEYTQLTFSDKLLKLVFGIFYGKFLNFKAFNFLLNFKNYKGCFSLNDSSFHFLNNREILDFGSIANCFYTEGIFHDDDNLFIFDTIDEDLLNFSLPVYLDAIIDNIKNKKLYIRFHHSNTNEHKEKVQALLQVKNIQFQIVPDSIILEPYLNINKINLIGFTSSLLLYNKILSNNSKSYFHIPIHLKNSYNNPALINLFKKFNLIEIDLDSI